MRRPWPTGGVGPQKETNTTLINPYFKK